MDAVPVDAHSWKVLGSTVQMCLPVPEGEVSSRGFSEAVVCQLGVRRIELHPSWRGRLQAHTGKTAGKGMLQLLECGGAAPLLSPAALVLAVRLPLLSGCTNIYFF